jgi:predicted Zn finger-like uncharacterized protein
MGKKRPERTARRAQERAARALVAAREKLAELSAGGAPEHPIVVESSAVVEARVRNLECPQCAGPYRVDEHAAPAAALRAVAVRCQRCGVARTLWFRLAPAEPN